MNDRYLFDENNKFGAATSRELHNGRISANATLRETAPAATERVHTEQYNEHLNDTGKNNMDDMRQKL